MTNMLMPSLSTEGVTKLFHGAVVYTGWYLIAERWAKLGIEPPRRWPVKPMDKADALWMCQALRSHGWPCWIVRQRIRRFSSIFGFGSGDGSYNGRYPDEPPEHPNCRCVYPVLYGTSRGEVTSLANWSV